MVTRTKKIFVGGLSAPTTLEDVKNYFEQFGRVRTLKHCYHLLIRFYNFLVRTQKIAIPRSYTSDFRSKMPCWCLTNRQIDTGMFQHLFPNILFDLTGISLKCFSSFVQILFCVPLFTYKNLLHSAFSKFPFLRSKTKEKFLIKLHHLLILGALDLWPLRLRRLWTKCVRFISMRLTIKWWV